MTIEEQIFAYIKQRPPCVSKREIARALGYTDAQVKKCLSRLAMKEQIISTRFAYWEVTDTAKAPTKAAIQRADPDPDQDLDLSQSGITLEDLAWMEHWRKPRNERLRQSTISA